jgi:hypothetical protein
LDADWFTISYDDDLDPAGWAKFPWVNLLAKVFPDLAEIIVVIPRILMSSPSIYSTLAIRSTMSLLLWVILLELLLEASHILQSLLLKSCSSRKPEVKRSFWYGRSSRSMLTDKGGLSDGDPIPVRVFIQPPQVHWRHFFNYFASIINDHYDIIIEKLIDLKRYTDPAAGEDSEETPSPTPTEEESREAKAWLAELEVLKRKSVWVPESREFIHRPDHESGFGPTPTGKAPPKLRFHEGSVKDGLKLFRLPHKDKNDRFNFRQVFGRYL